MGLVVIQGPRKAGVMDVEVRQQLLPWFDLVFPKVGGGAGMG
jgi:hypothetical protein